MIKNTAFRLIVHAAVISSLLASNSARAFSGGVTTVYSKPNATTVQRATSGPATTPELNQTYQRTMRTAQTAAAASRAARGFIKTFAFIGTALTLVTLAQELKGIWSKNDSGENVISVPDSTQCSTAPCTEYTADEGTLKKWYGSSLDACKSAIGTFALAREETIIFAYIDAPRCVYSRSSGGYYATYYSQRTTDVVQPPKYTVLSPDQLDKAIENSPSLPAILDELDKKGMPVPFPLPEVEDMPQAIVISPVTTTHPDGSKSIEKTTLQPYRDTTDGPVQWKKSTTTTEVSKPAADGSTTQTDATTTVDSGKSSTPEKAPEPPPTDTPLPAQPKLYKQKYPNGVTGVWKDQHDLMAATPLFTLAKGLMPTVANSGQCPTMPVNLTFSKWANFGVKDVAPPCQVWDWGRAICIVSALLLARQLIFGG